MDGKGLTARIKNAFGFILEILKKVLGEGGFQVLPQTVGGGKNVMLADAYRRLVKDYEEKTEHSEAFIQMAMIRLMLRKLALRKIQTTSKRVR